MSSASTHEQFHQVDASEWDYQPAEPDVGFEGGWYHEDCPAEDGPERRIPYGIVTRNGDTETVTCNACGGFTDHVDHRGDQA